MAEPAATPRNGKNGILYFARSAIRWEIDKDGVCRFYHSCRERRIIPLTDGKPTENWTPMNIVDYGIGGDEKKLVCACGFQWFFRWQSPMTPERLVEALRNGYPDSHEYVRQ